MDEHISTPLPRVADGSARPAIETDVKHEVTRAAPRNKTRARLIQVASVVILVVLLLLLWRFLGDKSSPRAAGTGREVVPIEMAAVTQRDVPIQIKSIGNVEALSTIAVRSQVEGALLRVGFAPGQEVKKGDLLFTIDPRPLQAQLNQAEANLLKAMAAVKQGQDIVAKDEATANNDRVIAKRDASLLEAGVIPREQYDNDEAKLQSDE